MLLCPLDATTPFNLYFTHCRLAYLSPRNRHRNKYDQARQQGYNTTKWQFTAVHLLSHIAQPYPTTQTDPVSGISVLHSSGEYSVNFWTQREKCRWVNY